VGGSSPQRVVLRLAGANARGGNMRPANGGEELSADARFLTDAQQHQTTRTRGVDDAVNSTWRRRASNIEQNVTRGAASATRVRRCLLAAAAAAPARRARGAA